MTRQKEEGVRLDHQVVRALMQDVLQGLEVPEDESALVADTLLEASLVGYDPHGIMRLPKYVDGIRKGTMLPGANIEIVRETSSCVYLDGGWALGPVTAWRAVHLASTKARQTGVGCVSTFRSNDIASLGSYVRPPALRGLIAILMVNDAGGGPVVVPWGGLEGFLSTNPIAAGIPRSQGPPIVIDLSTSVVSGGKVQQFANLGRPVPEGWIVDQSGCPATDPNTLYATPRQSALLPLGGMLAGYKGFALGLLVDILAGGLGGSGCSTGEEAEREANGVFVLIIDPATFGPPERFTGAVENLIGGLKGVPRAPEVEEILMPGERAERERQHRLEQGIPIDSPTWQKISRILRELGIEEKYPG